MSNKLAMCASGKGLGKATEAQVIPQVISVMFYFVVGGGGGGVGVYPMVLVYDVQVV